MALLGFLRYAVGIPLCFGLSNAYYRGVYESLVRPRALESLSKKISDSPNVEEALGNIKEAINALPDFLAGAIDTSALNAKNADVAERVLSNVLEPTLLILTKGILFLITFVIFFAVTGILLNIIHKARKKGRSVLSKADRILGAVLGFAKALFVVLALVMVLSFFRSLGMDNSFTNQVDASRLIPIIENIIPIKSMIGG